MNFLEYQAAALRTARHMPDQTLDLVHAALGMQTETGEFATEVKRLFAYNKPLTEEMHAHMVEELGDALWYFAVAADALGVSMRAIAERNIRKLQLRYPDAYSDELAEARLDKGGKSAAES